MRQASILIPSFSQLQLLLSATRVHKVTNKTMAKPNGDEQVTIFDLPSSVLSHIISFLDARSVLSACQVSLWMKAMQACARQLPCIHCFDISPRPIFQVCSAWSAAGISAPCPRPQALRAHARVHTGGACWFNTMLCFNG